jgi:hypothetical protein
MEIKISVLNTNTATNETTIKDFVSEPNEIEIAYVEDEEDRIMNESFNAYIFLCDGFGEVLDLCENLDFEDDFENIFPIYRATDREKRKRGYIYDLKEKDGIKTRIILIAPKHYLSSLL